MVLDSKYIKSKVKKISKERIKEILIVKKSFLQYNRVILGEINM